MSMDGPADGAWNVQLKDPPNEVAVHSGSSPGISTTETFACAPNPVPDTVTAVPAFAVGVERVMLDSTWNAWEARSAPELPTLTPIAWDPEDDAGMVNRLTKLPEADVVIPPELVMVAGKAMESQTNV
jgi:hypothetical protein